MSIDTNRVYLFVGFSIHEPAIVLKGLFRRGVPDFSGRSTGHRRGLLRLSFRCVPLVLGSRIFSPRNTVTEEAVVKSMVGNTVVETETLAKFVTL